MATEVSQMTFDTSEANGQSIATPKDPPAQHKRTYQACIPCRRRKVRCDLGSVDNPHDPPCVRCRRESKECFFSATRRKRRPADGSDGLLEGDYDDQLDDYVSAMAGRGFAEAAVIPSLLLLVFASH